MRQSGYSIPFPNPFTPMSQISSFLQHLENKYSLKSKDSGVTKIDISISWSDDNTQSSISDSFSASSETVSLEEVEQLTEMYVLAMEEAFSKESSGNTPKDSSPKNG
jgi:hypothetical protein